MKHFTSDRVTDEGSESEKSDVDIDNSESSMEFSSGLEENGENNKQGLFAPFNHNMKPNFEYLQLKFKYSSLNQEAATKLIADRHKIMMDNSARYKTKKKNNITFPQLSHNVNIVDIEETTELLHSLQLSSPCLAEDQPEESSDNHLERSWNNFEFLEHDYGEAQFDILEKETEHYHYDMEDIIREMMIIDIDEEEKRLPSMFLKNEEA